MSKKTIAERKRQIKDAIKQNGPYSHNIISLVLRGVANDFGKAEANKLVRDFSLEELYQIPESPEEETSEGEE